MNRSWSQWAVLLAVGGSIGIVGVGARVMDAPAAQSLSIAQIESVHGGQVTECFQTVVNACGPSLPACSEQACENSGTEEEPQWECTTSFETTQNDLIWFDCEGGHTSGSTGCSTPVSIPCHKFRECATTCLETVASGTHWCQSAGPEHDGNSHDESWEEGDECRIYYVKNGPVGQMYRVLASTRSYGFNPFLQ